MGWITKLVRENLIFTLIFILALLLLCQNVKKPFIGHHDFNSAFFSQIARNLTVFPPDQTKLGLLIGSGFRQPKEFNYYIDNVPLYPWILAIDFKLLGIGELQARGLSALFSLGSLLLIYLITLRLFSKTAANLASLFYCLTAFFIYFGIAVFPEPQTIFFSLCTFYFFHIWFKTSKRNAFTLMLVFNFLSLLTVWGSYFLNIYLVIYYLLFKKNKEYLKISALLILPILTFILFLLHVSSLYGPSAVKQLQTAFLSRSDLLTVPAAQQATILQFLSEEFHRSVAYFSKTTLLLSFVFTLLVLSRIKKREDARNWMLLFSLFLWGLSYILIFRSAAYIHDYFLIYLSPYIAISAAVITTKIPTFFNKLPGKVVLAITIVAFLLPVLQFIFVKNFTSALLKTNANIDGYNLGTFLHSNTAYSDKILVLSGQFGAHFGTFADYYSDRSIAYSDFSKEALAKLVSKNYFDYIVYVEGRDTLMEVVEYLDANYKSKKFDKFILYTYKKTI